MVTTTLAGYDVTETLWSDDQTALLRGRSADGESALLRVVYADRPEVLAQLEREFALGGVSAPDCPHRSSRRHGAERSGGAKLSPVV